MAPKYILSANNSLGTHLQVAINYHSYMQNLEDYIDVLTVKGGMASDVCERAIDIQRVEGYDGVIYNAMTNHLSIKRANGRIYPRYDCVCQCTESLWAETEYHYYRLKSYFPKVVLQSLIGINFLQYNQFWFNEIIPQPLGQTVVNQSIPIYNQAARRTNHENLVVAPWTSDLVHHWDSKKKCFHHNYSQLKDGIHPSPELNDNIARKIVSAVKLGYF